MLTNYKKQLLYHKVYCNEAVYSTRFLKASTKSINKPFRIFILRKDDFISFSIKAFLLIWEHI